MPKNFPIVSAALLSSCLSPLAFAETADSVAPDVPATWQDDGELDDEIIVKGQYLYNDQINAIKAPTPIIDVPQSLSITTADQIIRQGFDSIGDIVMYTPGVVNSQGEGHRDAVVFRGVRSTADFFLDGVRDDVQYYRSLYNLEQVEILRGPNALLFGRGGTGGVLNRVTKKGLLGDDFTGYKSSVDTFGAFDVQVDTNISVGENAAFRLNAYYEKLNNHRDFYQGDRLGINPSAKIRLGETATLDLSYEYINNDRFVDRGIPSDANGDPARTLLDITFGDPQDNVATLEAHFVRALLEKKFSDNIKGNFSAFYGDYDKLYGNVFSVGYDETTNIVTFDGYLDTTQRQNLVLSTNLIGEFDTKDFFNHVVIAGAEYIDTVNNNDRFNSFFDTAATDGRRTDRESFLATRPIALDGGVGITADGRPTRNSFTADLNDDTEADITVFSAYIQDQVEVSDYLDIVVGLRFDSFDITVDNIAAFNATGTRTVLNRTDSRVSPRFGAIFKPQENISIYGSYSESFLPRSGEQFADINPPDDALDPNTFSNIEAGLKWDFAAGLSFTAALFQVEQRSPQVSDNNPDTLDVIESKIRGIEAQILGQVTDSWFISAGYSYMDGNQVDRSGLAGNRVRELPQHTLNMWSNYQLTEKFGLGAGFTYQDESFADNGNAVILPDFFRVDAAAYYDVNENLRLQVNVENLTDITYFPNAHTADNLTVAPPLNVRFTVTGRF